MKYLLVNPGGKYDDKKNYNFVWSVVYTQYFKKFITFVKFKIKKE